MLFFERQDRDALRREGISAEEAAYVVRRVPLVALLDDEERCRLYGHMAVFLAEKRFEGCGGQEVTREMALVIAAQACLLVLNLDSDYFPRCTSILVYPTGFLGYESDWDLDGIVFESEEERDGESWERGAVVVAWDAITHDLAGLTGRNVVLHEFAHQLDQTDGVADGWPSPMDPDVEQQWLDVMGPAFQAHVSATRAGRHTAIEEYGATNPAEFFAVLTELFFERPGKLSFHHPRLYALLAAYFRQDPIERVPAESR